MPTPWDAVFKQVLQRFFQKQQVSVNTEVEVGRLPRTIDIAILCSPEESHKLALVSPFTFLAKHNLLEFKSSSDPLTSAEYKRIIARAYLYMAEVELDDLSLLTVCAVTSGKPVKVLTKIPELVKFSKVSDALYKSDNFPLYVLVVAVLRSKKGEARISDRGTELSFAALFQRQKTEGFFERTCAQSRVAGNATNSNGISTLGV